MEHQEEYKGRKVKKKISAFVKGESEVIIANKEVSESACTYIIIDKYIYS